MGFGLEALETTVIGWRTVTAASESWAVTLGSFHRTLAFVARNPNYTFLVLLIECFLIFVFENLFFQLY